MSNKIETLAKIQKVGIVAVVRATSIKQAEKITDACIAGVLLLLSLHLPFLTQTSLLKL